MSLSPRQREVLHLLVQHGELRLTEAAQALKIAKTSTRDHLEALRAKGLAEVKGRAWRTTTEALSLLAQAPASPGLKLVTEHPAWRPLMAAIPLAEYRALLRLTLAVVLLRQNAPDLSPMPWLGVFGPPGTGKSVMGQVARHLMGGSVFKVGLLTSGEAIGRRVQESKTSWDVTPPETINGPVTVLDELAEAKSEVERALFALVDDRPTVRIEGRELPQRAAVFATWNPEGREVPLPDGARRRGLLLDTTPYRGLLLRAFQHDLAGMRIHAALDQHPSPWFLPPSFTPQAVSEAASRASQRVVFSALTSTGKGELPLMALGGLAAAYRALFGMTEEAAAAEAASDMCMLAASRPGLLGPDWREKLTTLRAQASLPEAEPATPSEDAADTLEARIARAGYRSRLLARLESVRDGLYQAGQRKGLSVYEEERRKELLGRLVPLAEALNKAPTSELESLETLLQQESGAASELLAQIEARLNTLRAHEQQLRIREQQAREQQAALHKQVGEYLKLAGQLERYASQNPEGGMQELLRRGWVQEAQSAPGGGAGIALAGSAALAAAIGYLQGGAGGAFRGVLGTAISADKALTPKRVYLDREGRTIHDSRGYLHSVAQALRQHAATLERQAGGQKSR